MPHTTSRNGVLFIANREALVLSAYQDGPHCSIGFGSNSPALRLGDRITVKEAFRLLKEGLATREQFLNKELRKDVNQQQFDALLSLYYQNGNKKDGQGRPGFTHMLSLINAGKFSEAGAYFPQCDRNSAGEEISGLRKRRLMEQSIFLHGEYGILDPIPYWPGDPHRTRMQQYHLQPGDL